MQKITPCLWFNFNAEEAVTFYTSIFKNSRIMETSYYPEGSPGPEGAVMTITFELDGQQFMALNGGPQFPFTEAVSLVAYCDTQEELDEKWDKLLADGGKPSVCGWLKDKFGMSWQIVPAILGELIKGNDPKRTKRVMDEVMKMVKLDIKTMKDAAEGNSSK